MTPVEPVETTAADGEQVLTVATVHLPADPRSAARARQLVRDTLAEAGRQQWVETCEVAVTEIVTNAVLHAHTDSVVTVTVFAGQVRVEVRDFSPALPVQRDYTAQATTGRGLALVAALVHDHGISDVGPDGKTVWFTVRGDPAEQTEDELLEAWADAEWDLDELLAEPPRPAATTTVRLLGLPPTLWLAARQHHDALLRELQLYLTQHDTEDVDIASTDRARATISTAVVAAVDAAQRAGTARRPVPDRHPSPLEAVPEPLDLRLDVPSELDRAFAVMQDTLDAAERLAQAGLLLTRPGLPEVVAVRDWACEQITAQLAGVPATAWPGTAQERFTTAVHGRDTEPDLSDWDVAAVRDSDRGIVAADEANRIVAVSRPLAELTGWQVDDLVGRRVVTLIPPALREAHVAGFTRHLTTGEAHALDTPLILPVLHHDGHEITCEFLVQQAPTRKGRAFYLAWIQAVE